MLRKFAIGAALAALPSAAFAQAPAAPAADSGDTAWILASAALVLLMTLPGLGLFYGGLVRAKNVLSVLLQIGAVAARRLAAVDRGRLHARVRRRDQRLARQRRRWMLSDLGDAARRADASPKAPSRCSS